jgi:hypothetical protein
MTTPTASPAFTGWLRQGRGRWRAVCHGDTYDRAFAALLKVPSSGATDRLVMATGRDPNKEARIR